MFNAIVPNQIKLYHIIHISKLPAILAEKYLISDAEVRKRPHMGITIGMSEIKNRRLKELKFTSYPNLYVGECVPFYFCPRSIMLYLLHMRNHRDIEYREGQAPIIHLVADLQRAIEWAEQNNLRWVFTDSNAGSRYFNDYSNLSFLNKINWNAIEARDWQNCKEQKQAEFLIEQHFPWELVEEIGAYSPKRVEETNNILATTTHKPPVEVKNGWYYNL
jgi:hypothetical protein